ncbi:MAG: PilW family protein [Gallionella sp.]
MMKPSKQHSYYQTGFSLVEIMVGLVIGLLATLVIMQVFSVFEGQKRTTTGAADAQTNGSIALHIIGRELQQAGYGLLPVTNSALECTTLTINGVVDATTPNRLSPVVITDGGTAAGASDSITIRYGDSSSGGIPSTITAMGAPTASDATVGNNLGCQAGDTTLVIAGATCALSVASAVPGTTTITLANTTTAATGAALACLGAWNEITFRINPGYDPTDPLNSQTYLERNGAPGVADIVNIQAQYGISAAATSNQITQWLNPTGGTWATPTIADRNRIKAVRIAVVARNGLLEKENVTVACTTAKGTVNNGPCAWDDTNFDAAPAINLSNDPLWQRYRYRVFETILPLRNVIWAKDTL